MFEPWGVEIYSFLKFDLWCQNGRERKFVVARDLGVSGSLLRMGNLSSDLMKVGMESKWSDINSCCGALGPIERLAAINIIPPQICGARCLLKAASELIRFLGRLLAVACSGFWIYLLSVMLAWPENESAVGVFLITTRLILRLYGSQSFGFSKSLDAKKNGLYYKATKNGVLRLCSTMIVQSDLEVTKMRRHCTWCKVGGELEESRTAQLITSEADRSERSDE
jgi:hypothetical protein